MNVPTRATGYHPYDFTPPKVKGMRNQCVPCPSCGAEVKKPCINGTGGRYAGSHVSRRRMALRHLNAVAKAAEAQGELVT